MGFDGRQGGDTFTHIEARYSKSAEYLLDLQLVTAYFLLVGLGMWWVRPPLESPLDFRCKPNVD